MKRVLSYLLCSLIALTVAAGCQWFGKEKEESGYDKVLIIAAPDADNGLWGDVTGNINTMKAAWLPGYKSRYAVLLVAQGNSSSSVSDIPRIIRMYKKDNKSVLDTLKTYSAGDALSDPSILGNALAWVRDNFQSKGYGMLVSTHGTGWLPEQYYNTHPVVEPLFSTPLSVHRNSLGEEYVYKGGVKTRYEMTLEEFREAITIPLDYIVFDACLMGCVEVAYELREVAPYLLVSAAEVIGSGFDYSDMVSTLLRSDTVPGLKSVGQRYYDLYNSQSGWSRTATVALIDTGATVSLASAVKPLAEKYRTAIASLEYVANMDSRAGYTSPVQGFYSSGKHWFFDLEDIFVKAGMDASEQAGLERAISACVLYKANTPEYLTYPIDTFCGLTMYLPCAGDEELDTYYRTLGWNNAVSLVN